MVIFAVIISSNFCFKLSFLGKNWTSFVTLTDGELAMKKHVDLDKWSWYDLYG